MNIDIRFADNPRRGGGNVGRGGRGGGRGGRGRGGGPDSYRESQYRGGNRDGGGNRDDRPRARSSGSHRERAPNVADEMDFPSLDKTVDTIKA